jgi:ATP-dependent Clp protease ATP-binding subunit ClpB
LKRVIQKNLQDGIAELVLRGAIKDGQALKVTSNKDGLVINGASVKQAA